MRFAVDAWDPSYGSSMEAEGEPLTETKVEIKLDVELLPERWRPVSPSPDVEPPGTLLFVDGVRRVDARVWIDNDTGDDATPALCASYAAGVVCCAGGKARLVSAQLRRGLFSVAPHASDIVTRAGTYQAFPVTAAGSNGQGSLMASLSQALQRRLADIEVITATDARGSTGKHGSIGKHGSTGGRDSAGEDGLAGTSDDDLLVIDGPLYRRQHLPRALGYIKSHRTTYLPPELNAMVAALEPGQRTPVFLMGTSWDRHSWYLRLPGPPGAPWSGIVRVECAADLPAPEAIRLAGLSQSCLGRFASAPYKDSRAPQNLHPIAGLERALRHRLGDPQFLYRSLRAASLR